MEHDKTKLKILRNPGLHGIATSIVCKNRKIDENNKYMPGKVVIFGSQWKYRPSQYAIDCGIWKISS
jgi:hypothetical protein